MRRAVVDVGSNSVLLTVAERREGVWIPVLETSRVTGLGVGTKITGLLGEPGILATLEALKEAFQEAGASAIRAAGTMALRIASNAADFLALAERQGTPVEILSGEREAELGFRAAADDPLFKSCQRLTIIDPGGHSTELATAIRTPSGWRMRLRRSYAIGTLALLSGTLSAERPALAHRLAACQEIDDEIGLCFLPGAAGEVATLGATGTNLVSIRERMSEWQPDRVHGAVLDYEEIGRAVGWLCDMGPEERRDLIGIEKGREATLPAGALILERFLYAVRAPSCRVSVRGWRHALLAEPWPGRNS